MPATVIAERVGWTWGTTVFADRVRQLRVSSATTSPCCAP
jgi:hypothetical protein